MSVQKKRGYLIRSTYSLYLVLQLGN